MPKQKRSNKRNTRSQKKYLTLVSGGIFAVAFAFAAITIFQIFGRAATNVTPAAGNSGAVCGTWAIYQVSSVAELNSMKTHIQDALAIPGVVGFSLRFPWDAADISGSATTSPILDTAKQIASGSGKALSIRFMAGAHTPARVFNAGAAYYVVNGSKVPTPWSNSTGDSQIFVNEYTAYANKLAAWSRANGVHLLHLSWWGKDWAELNNGAEVRAAEGYTPAKWLAGQEQLIDAGLSVAGNGVAVELPLSGYGPLSGGESAALADYLVSKVGSNSDKFYIQANGWGPNGEWGAPSSDVENQFDAVWNRPLRRGLQMIQPDGYDWAPVFARLTNNSATYGEVYLPSFWQIPGPSAAYNHNTADRITQLKSEIKKFSDATCGTGGTTTPPPPPVDNTKPTVSVTGPSNNATVSGTVNVSASASDNVAVKSVAFKIDGTTVLTDTTSPYAYSWNTTSTTNGDHTIVAVATDTNNNVATSTTVTAKVSNATTPPPSGGGTGGGSTTPPGDTTPPDTGPVTVELPELPPSVAPTDVAKVTVSINGKQVAVAKDTSVPPTIDTSTLSNGEHTVTVAVTDKDGNTYTKQQVIEVHNNLNPYERVRNFLFSPWAGISGRTMNFMFVSGTAATASMIGAAAYVVRRFGWLPF